MYIAVKFILDHFVTVRVTFLDFLDFAVGVSSFVDYFVTVHIWLSFFLLRGSRHWRSDELHRGEFLFFFFVLDFQWSKTKRT